MLKKVRGFTLIELLIVVAIIGILAALLIPNAITAIQKAKQKSTMKDIVVISTAIADHVTDNGVAPPNPGGEYDATHAFYTALSPFYVKITPTTDQWGSPYQAWCGTAATEYGVATTAAADDFLMASFGRNRTKGDFTFDSTKPQDGLFVLTQSSDFNNDLVCWNGSWIRAPKVWTDAAAGT